MLFCFCKSHASVTIPAFPFLVVILMYVGLGVWTWWLTRDAQIVPPDVAPPKENPYKDWVIAENQNSTINRTILDGKNPYADWIIEEEKETPPGTRSVPGGVKNDFPFR